MIHLFGIFIMVVMFLAMGIIACWDHEVVGRCGVCGERSIRLHGGTYMLFSLAILSVFGITPNCPECGGLGKGGAT